jgi:hypothetical protein
MDKRDVVRFIDLEIERGINYPPQCAEYMAHALLLDIQFNYPNLWAEIKRHSPSGEVRTSQEFLNLFLPGEQN